MAFVFTVLCDISGSRFLLKPPSTSNASPLKLTTQQIKLSLSTNSILEWRVTTGSVHQHRLPLENIVHIQKGFPAQLGEYAILFATKQHVFHLETTRGKFLVLSVPNARKLDIWVNKLTSQIQSNQPTHNKHKRRSNSSLATMGKRLLHTVDPLAVAARTGDQRTIEKFVRERRRHRGVHSVDQPSIESALFLAAQAGYAGCVEPLLRVSAAFYRHHDGRTIMHAAITSGNDNVVRLVAQHSFDLADEPDSDGNTPVHLAVENGDRESLLALLQTAAETNLGNHKGLTPLALARQRRAKLKRSRSSGSSSSSSKSNVKVKVANEIVKMLKEYGARMEPAMKKSQSDINGSGETDMTRIMSIWDAFFSNAMKWRLGQEMENNGVPGAVSAANNDTSHEKSYFQPVVPALPSHRLAWSESESYETKSSSSNRNGNGNGNGRLTNPDWFDNGGWESTNNNGGGGGWRENRDEWYSSNNGTTHSSFVQPKIKKDIGRISAVSGKKYTVYNGWKSNDKKIEKKETEQLDMWTAVIDEVTGKWYGIHQQSGETKWWNEIEVVNNTKVKEINENQIVSTGYNENVTTYNGWETVFDENSGMWYYINSVTGVTQWEVPDECSNVSVSVAHYDEIAQDTTQLDMWTAYIDDVTGKWYGIHQTTGETKWWDEIEIEAGTHEEEQIAWTGYNENVTTIDGWETMFDDATGKWYGIHQTTGETKWWDEIESSHVVDASIAHYDEYQESWYYVSQTTGISTWEPQSDIIITAQATQVQAIEWPEEEYYNNTSSIQQVNWT